MPAVSHCFRSAAIASWLFLSANAMTNAQNADDVARGIVLDHETRIRPVEIASSRAWWDANVSGADEAFKLKEEAENKLDALLSDRERFEKIKKLDGKVKDPQLARQIRVLYLQALPKQVEPELLKQMVARGNAIEKRFGVFRAKVDGKELADSEVRKILKQSRDSQERRAVWEASKEVGREVEEELRTLVGLRNKAARELGFADYHAMQLEINEQSQAEVIKLFDDLDDLTREPFAAAKRRIDAKLAEIYSIGVDELQPWHYQDPYFQEAPAIYKTNLDAAYAKADIPALCRKFYEGIGLPIEDVLKRSDLYEKPGKNPHAFCTDIDREGDVRVLANIVPNEYWMGTMLHELGHSVYSSKNTPRELPYILRTDAHILATEGVAMMFERFSKSADWLEQMGVKVEDPKAFNEAGEQMRRDKLLIFSRWCQVMLRFEKGLYNDPSQDLNALWWKLVEKYQLIKRPEGRDAPDYASKIHIVVAPAYYHNYMMGELFACQVNHTIAREVLKTADAKHASYVGRKDVGRYMKERVFAPGRMLDWNELTKFATGEPLTPKAFAADFSEK